jgi:ABC-type branched-subunit amino acid transport system substrate-binding protein
VLPNAKAIDREARTLIPELQQQGYFGKWDPQGVTQDVRVGLITIEEPGYLRTADGVVKPLLAKLGFPVEEVRINVADTSQRQTQMQQAVLRFKQKNVTHVMFLPGFDAFYFYQSAENQQYRPRYAVDSNSFPSLMETAAPAQAKGAVGIGWTPSFDVSQSDQSRYPPSAQEKRCYALMQEGGEDARNRSSRAGNFCDMVWLFEAAANKAGRNLAAGSLAAGLDAVRSWDFLGFPTDFAKQTPDSSYSYRRLAFDDVQCKCFMYRSGPLSDR